MAGETLAGETLAGETLAGIASEGTPATMALPQQLHWRRFNRCAAISTNPPTGVSHGKTKPSQEGETNGNHATVLAPSKEPPAVWDSHSVAHAVTLGGTAFPVGIRLSN